MSEVRPPSLPSDIAAHFEAEREIPAVSSDARSRLLAGLAAAGAVGLGATAIAEAAGAVATGATGAGGTAVASAAGTVGTVGTAGVQAVGLLARILATRAPFGLAMFLLGGAGGMAVQARLRPVHTVAVATHAAGPRRGNVPTVVVPAAEPVAPAVEPAALAPMTAAPATSAPVAVRPSARPSVARPTPAPEIEPRPTGDQDGLLVDRARSALNGGMLAEAVAALRESELRYPSSDLSDARECMWIRVLVAQRRYDDARTRGQRFHQRFPGSVQGPTVDEALASIPDGG